MMSESEYQALRREIEVRLLRETIYKAIDALNTKTTLDDEIKKNDEHIALIGQYLLNHGDEWEKVYAEKKPS